MSRSPQDQNRQQVIGDVDHGHARRPRGGAQRDREGTPVAAEALGPPVAGRAAGVDDQQPDPRRHRGQGALELGDRQAGAGDVQVVAAAVMVMEREKAEWLGLRPLVRFVGYADGGVPPQIIVGIIGVETFYGRITGSVKGDKDVAQVQAILDGDPEALETVDFVMKGGEVVKDDRE